jgi:hypothetical protein
MNAFDKIKELNPEFITVDDICRVFGLTRIKARTLCEMAVQSGVFKTGKTDGEIFYILIK